ncbi:hypothetical protein EVAR_34120_1 [Eumeta japonica]|uniref:Uncharacterized protein n=1 Tax=Eumeta variegata TaxID=151549 RepID=A0A4C1WMI7_EUMVA|nr:hypothetical protein EVAR_34120_1 [Eumeta japonica]
MPSRETPTLRDETGAEVCTARESKDIEIGEEPLELYEFTAKVNGVVRTVKEINKTKQLNNPEIIHVISKFPHALRLK